MGLPHFNTKTKRNGDRSKCEKSDEITVIYVCFYEIFGQVYEQELHDVRMSFHIPSDDVFFDRLSRGRSDLSRSANQSSRASFQRYL